MADEISARYGNMLTGSYDCVDRIVLNAYYSLGHNPGRVPGLVAAVARRQRRATRRHAPTADGGQVLWTGASVQQGNRDLRHRLQPGRPQAPDRRGVPDGGTR